MVASLLSSRPAGRSPGSSCGRRPNRAPSRGRMSARNRREIRHGSTSRAASRASDCVIGSRRSRPNDLKLIFGARRVLAPLPLGRVDHPRHPLRQLGVEARGDDLGDARVAVDVAGQDRVEQLVVGQRVAVELAGPQLCRRRLLDRVGRDRAASRRAPRRRRCATGPAAHTSDFGTSLIGAKPPTASP